MNLRRRSWMGEASYAGNLGFEEMMLFYRKATERQIAEMERLLDSELLDKVYALLRKVTGIDLNRRRRSHG